jgi:hypothetical protein
MVKKNCEVWRKMGLFGPDSDRANQLPFSKIFLAHAAPATQALVFSKKSPYLCGAILHYNVPALG